MYQLIYKFSVVCVIFISILQLCHSNDEQNTPEDFVNAHNKFREEVGVGPMTWCPSIAKFAEYYANQRKNDCAVEHSGTDKYGENIAMGYGGFSAEHAVKLWVNQKLNYDYKANSCAMFKACGYYTQVVWKNSTKLGCARVKCLNGARFITCNYDPKGNVPKEKPY
ncbi:pathogenesis-related protein PR-1 type-like [Rutidosis leptorrhynchoides]|uniref:pathogenesis-related protein PR-1 type-like n=1 Tax=Rutidosis leptorrhynchoides TaxID=125765 RepID=UPI003A98E092